DSLTEPESHHRHPMVEQFPQGIDLRLANEILRTGDFYNVDNALEVAEKYEVIIGRQMLPALLEVNHILVDVSGDILRKFGKITIRFSLGSTVQIEHDFIVWGGDLEFAGDGLLGLDFLDKFKPVLDFKNDILSLRGHNLTLHDDRSIPRHPVIDNNNQAGEAKFDTEGTGNIGGIRRFGGGPRQGNALQCRSTEGRLREERVASLLLDRDKKVIRNPFPQGESQSDGTTCSFLSHKGCQAVYGKPETNSPKESFDFKDNNSSQSSKSAK
ncbi:uncharacterized protein BDFB_014277, partial [Asbolus verrucosus]